MFASGTSASCTTSFTMLTFSRMPMTALVDMEALPLSMASRLVTAYDAMSSSSTRSTPRLNPQAVQFTEPSGEYDTSA